MKKVIFTKHNVIIFLILLISLIFRLYKINFQSAWLDEIFTLNNASESKSILEIFEALKTDVHPPFYYYLVHVFFKIFGDSIIVARLISVFFGLAGLLAMYYLVIELLNNKKIGILALMLLMINHFHIYYSQEARMYTMLFFTTIMAFIFMIKFIKKPNIKSAILHATFASLMIYTHFFALFTLIAQYIILLFFILKPYKVDSKKIFWLSGLSGIITLILYLPAIIILINAAKLKSVWIQTPERDIYTTFFKEFFGFAEISIYIIVFSITFYLIKIFNKNEQSINYLNPIKDKEIFSFFVLFSWFVIALIIPHIISYINLPIIVSRYYINLIPIIVIFASIGLFYIKSRIIKCLLILTFILFSFVDLVFVKKYYTQPTKTQFREGTNFIIENNKNNTKIVTSLGWYFNYFLNNNNVKYEIVNKPLDTYVGEIKIDTTKLNDFWYIDAHNSPYKITENSEKFLEKNFSIENNIELIDCWAKHYVKKKNQLKTINIASFNLSENNNFSNINYWIESFLFQNNQVVINGWAYLKGKDAYSSKIRLVLIGDNKEAYEFPVEMGRRTDITESMKDGFNYDNSGFFMKINTEKLRKGEYKIGILILNKNQQELVITDKKFVN